jgi:hypothetical protein
VPVLSLQGAFAGAVQSETSRAELLRSQILAAARVVCAERERKGRIAG